MAILFDVDNFYFAIFHPSLYDEDDDNVSPLNDKKTCLIAAAVRNQVDVLQDLLDSPEWYTLTDPQDGYPLLQIAIVSNSKEAFDYMISIPDFPIDFVNGNNETALVVSLVGYGIDENPIDQHFAYELIKKGANIDVLCNDDDTALHCALYRSHDNVAISLIEKGVDLNIQGNSGDTPLHLGICMREHVSEVVYALLINGATPSIDDFYESIKENVPFLIQEMLFMYTVDEYSDIEIDLEVVLKLEESPLFNELLKYPFSITIKYDPNIYFLSLCSMNFVSLKRVVEKFSDKLRDALTRNETPAVYVRNEIFPQNLDFLIESGFRDEILSFIMSIDSFDCFQHLFTLPNKITESSLIQQICFLLSYGLEISECDLHLVYKYFGYCELFKILLHMDIKMGIEKDWLWKTAMVTLMYNVTIDLDHFLKQRNEIYFGFCIESLCNYFVHPQLEEIYSDLVSRGTPLPVREFPDVPLLKELARNVFRKYFIKLFRIERCRQFYTLLNCVPIDVGVKKILSYERKLY